MKRIVELAHNLRGRLAHFSSDERGVSAVEFAMLLPLMVTLYLGTSEVSQGISADRKVTMTTRTMADLVSQSTNVTNSNMTDILNASTSVMYPYSTTGLTVTVTSISIDANNVAKVTWSDSYNGTARSVGSTVTVPTALNIANTSLIWSEVQYLYKPTIGYVITGTLTLKDMIYMAPRLSTAVTRTAS
jgi:Flp pilus assembly protein TadG